MILMKCGYFEEFKHQTCWFLIVCSIVMPSVRNYNVNNDNEGRHSVHEFIESKLLNASVQS